MGINGRAGPAVPASASDTGCSLAATLCQDALNNDKFVISGLWDKADMGNIDGESQEMCYGT